MGSKLLIGIKILFDVYTLIHMKLLEFTQRQEPIKSKASFSGL